MTTMFWLSLIVGTQLLGFGITLVRLAYDEWRQYRLSRIADRGLPDLEEAQPMETKNENVIPFGRGRACVRGFNFPHEVACDPDLDLEEKRAILAAWASDRHAVASMPMLRHLPGTPGPVTFSSIMEARAYLDRLSGAANDDEPPPPPASLKGLSTRYCSMEAA